MKKRVLALTLALAVGSAGLAGCGIGDFQKIYDALQQAKQKEAAGETTAGTETEVSKETTAPSEETKETETESETPVDPAAENGVPTIRYEVGWDGDWLNDPDLADTDYAYLSMAHVEYHTLTLVDDPDGTRGPSMYPNLQARLEDYNEYRKQETYAYGEELVEAARYELDDALATGDYDRLNVSELDLSERYYDLVDLYVVRSDAQTFSFYENVDTFTGGAHPWNKYYGYSIDPATGDFIELDDVITDNSELAIHISEAFYDQYPDAGDMVIVDNLTDTIQSELDDGSIQWMIDPYGVTFLFSPYELTAYAAGSQFVTLAYVKYSNILSADYFDLGEDLLPKQYGIRQDSYLMDKIYDAEGKFVRNNIYADMDPEYSIVDTLHITHGNHSFDYRAYDLYAYDYEPYTVWYDGEVYYYVELIGEFDGYGTTVIFKDTPTGLKLLETCEDTLCWMAPSDPTKIRMGRLLYALSTYVGYKDYHIGAGGILVTDDKYYRVETDPYYDFAIRTKQDMKVRHLADDNDETGEEITIIKGTALNIYRTDGEKTVDVIDKQGRIYRLFVEYDENAYWYESIGGQDIEDLFEGLYFAG
ncbi:MAG: DUF3298 domain-containing protein [Lachnospiraceae bacterium]|nr:DUF3298 domain-containing protein [Lachnospiraceae bacterium]